MDRETIRRTIRKVSECRAEAIAAIRTAELLEAWGSPKLLALAREYRASAADWKKLADEYERDVPAVFVA